jgi:hypothetical protein
LRPTKAFDTNALQLEPDFVGRLTRSLPLAWPSRHPVHVAQRLSAPFYKTPILSIPPRGERCYRDQLAHIERPLCKASGLAKQKVLQQFTWNYGEDYVSDNVC